MVFLGILKNITFQCLDKAVESKAYLHVEKMLSEGGLTNGKLV